MQISYAQRLEDWHLDRVFAGRSEGFYIDVGGGHPVADNVSFAFYLAGWKGIIVEPQQDLADLYARVRPRDITLCNLVGSFEGEVDFHVVERLHGFSTIIEEHARSALNFGATYTTRRMPMRTLRSIVQEYSADDVDFLKIDVEGAEGDVLAGAELATWRPRVIVVEAMVPGTMAEGWHQWQPQLLACGYRFAFFDSLNRFYVAEEVAELASRFPAEPAPWTSVQHLCDFGRAHERAEHPDHLLTRRLVHGFLAALPSLDPELLVDLLLRRVTGEGMDGMDVASLVGSGGHSAADAAAMPATQEDLRQLYLQLMDSDRFRAALGRIASGYDGGYV